MNTYKIYSREYNTDNYDLHLEDITNGFDSWKQWLTDNDAWEGHKRNKYKLVSYHIFKGTKEVFNTNKGYILDNYAEDELSVTKQGQQL